MAWERNQYIDIVSPMAAWLLTDTRSLFLVFSELHTITRGILHHDIIFLVHHGDADGLELALAYFR